MIGRTAIGACQARGIPAMLALQPGHVAWAYLKLGGGVPQWRFHNNVGGFNIARRHGPENKSNGTKTPWLGEFWLSTFPYLWTVWAYDYATRNLDSYVNSLLRCPPRWFFGNYFSLPDDLLDGISSSPWNMRLWATLLSTYNIHQGMLSIQGKYIPMGAGCDVVDEGASSANRLKPTVLLLGGPWRLWRNSGRTRATLSIGKSIILPS